MLTGLHTKQFQILRIVAHLCGKWHINGRGEVFQNTIYCTRSHHKFVFQRKRTYLGKTGAFGSSPLIMWSNAWVCGLLVVGMAGLNTVEGMDVSLLV